MANRLKKLARLQYLPGKPYVSAKPAYCTTEVVGYENVADGIVGMSFQAASDELIREAYRRSLEEWVSGFTLEVTAGTDSQTPVTKTVCYPAVAEVPAVPGEIISTAIDGWDGAARSIEAMDGDGAFSFTVSAGAIAVAVGLSDGAVSALPDALSHAFFVHQGIVEVIEHGSVVARAPSAHSGEKRLYISRSLGVVSFIYDGWHYTSTTMLSGSQYLQASIYASGDFVDSPKLGPAMLQSGEASGVLPALLGLASDGSAYAFAEGVLPPLAGGGDALAGGIGRIEAVLPALGGVGADHAYAQADGILPALGGDGGSSAFSPVIQRSTIVGTLPPIGGYGRGISGTVSRIEGVLPALGGIAADNAYAQASGQLPALGGVGLTLPDQPYGDASNNYLAVADWFIASTIQVASIDSELALADGFTLSAVLESEIFDYLAIGSEFNAYRALAAAIESTLLLASDVDGSDIPAVQYAVNVLSGALTEYSGFGFDAFALADTGLYACRPDGVYLAQAGDDDGTPISVAINFGSTDFGKVQAKNISEVFLGLTTDGEVTVRLRSDDTEREYRAAARGPMMRAQASRGAYGRYWNMKLDVADATEFELDTVEQIVAVAARRGMR